MPITWNGIRVTQGGNNVATYRTSRQNGCDSIVSLNLTIADTIIVTQILTKCRNELPFKWNNINITAGGNNVARYRTPGSNGCDSITVLNVIVNPTDSVVVNDSVCRNALPYVWNGINVTTSGNNVARYTKNNRYNCDSITILNLRIIDTLTQQVNFTICQTELPYTWNGQRITQGGNNIARYRATSRLGCDSIAILNLTVNPTKRDTITLRLCENQIPYLWNGISITRAGNNIATYKSSSLITGCDSFTTAHVIISDTNIVRINTFVCNENFPFRWNGMIIADSGNYRSIQFNINNCDSTINLTVRRGAKAVTLDKIIKEGCDSVIFDNVVYKQSTAWVDTTKTTSGCNSFYQPYQIYVHPTYLDTLSVRICIGESYEFNNKTFYSSATELHQFTSSIGCDSNVLLILSVEDLPTLDITMLNTKKLCVGDTITLKANGAQDYVWTVHQQTATENPFTFITYYTETIVHLKGMTDIGCTNETSYTIVSELCCEFAIPNAFTPNNDGLNDQFIPVIPGNPEKYELQIFDRWGKLVFTSIKKNQGWDGTRNGKLADPGVYYYYINITCRDGENTVKRGDITLIR